MQAKDLIVTGDARVLGNIYTKDGPVNSQGPRGDTGPQGPQGIGISKVEQTITSTEDGGSNVLTVTLEDGQTSTFTVKNGSKGGTADLTNLVNGTGGSSVQQVNSNAEGENSFAEGFNTTASGYASHAEGKGTTASEESSHAEGYYTKASGYASHAEGRGTVSSGMYSHVEGYYTTASVMASHAEGNSTRASGGSSHAEGYNTRASGDYSHVQGKYNIEDKNNKYAHIVGNGSSNTSCSNAHTLDWNGNAWFAGDVYVGGSNQDTDSYKIPRFIISKTEPTTVIDGAIWIQYE